NRIAPPVCSADMPGCIRGLGSAAVAACDVQVPAEYVHVLPSAGGPMIEYTVPKSTITWIEVENAIPALCLAYLGRVAGASCAQVLPSHCHVSVFETESLSRIASTVWVSGS